MIIAVRADHPSFRTVNFHRGFNVITAERTQESSDKDSRNGLGKTTLVEIIHFCLGASVGSESTLGQPELRGWTFFLDIELRGKTYTISRNTEEWGNIVLDPSGDWSDWPIQPKYESKPVRAILRHTEWRDLLGWALFDLPLSGASEKYTPTFRSLISYFIRRGRPAFDNPFQHFPRQYTWDMQVNNAFLLNLRWEYAQHWQVLKDREEDLKKLQQMARAGSLPALLGTEGELEATRVRLDEQIAEQRVQLETFQVHPQYYQIQQRANTLTELIHNLSNDNVFNRRMVELYEENLQQEQPAASRLVEDVYTEAGIVLPDLVTKRLNDVEEFHRRVMTNRRNFLENEINRLQQEIRRNNDQVQQYSEQRSELLEVLSSHGALEEYTKLQERHLQLLTALREVERKLELIREVARGRSALRIEREQLLLDARTDLEERRATRQQAISIFNANSEVLYDAPGNLVIDVDNNGFRFQVEIERDTSEGVKQIGKVFTYDLMLAQLWSARRVSPRFLIHDSAIFDGVDERQIAKAIELAAHRCEENGFQYLCMLNSDQIPYGDFSPGFDFDQYIIMALADDRPENSLLGIRF